LQKKLDLDSGLEISLLVAVFYTSLLVEEIVEMEEISVLLVVVVLQCDHNPLDK
jgi:hypothetical protein